jgi:hypothetical protein
MDTITIREPKRKRSPWTRLLRLFDPNVPHVIYRIPFDLAANIFRMRAKVAARYWLGTSVKTKVRGNRLYVLRKG